MRIPIYQVDAFASRLFAGNPAAVMPMEDFPADSLLQALAAENNLAETAFLVRAGDDYRLAVVHACHRGSAVRPRYAGKRRRSYGAP